MGSVWRVLWRALVVAAGLFVIYLAVTAVQVWLTSRHSEPRKAQAIVVMGAAQYNGVPSPDLESRLTEAESLWKRQLAPLIVVTGYKQPGDHYTEAQASYMWLSAHGVSADAIVQVGGNDSWASLSEASSVLRRRGLAKVLIVTDGFHEDRSLAIATDVGLTAWPVPAAHSPISGWSAVPYFAKETLGVAIGRVVGYSRLHDLDSSGIVNVG